MGFFRVKFHAGFGVFDSFPVTENLLKKRTLGGFPILWLMHSGSQPKPAFVTLISFDSVPVLPSIEKTWLRLPAQACYGGRARI
jgi:hypothetical protein